MISTIGATRGSRPVRALWCLFMVVGLAGCRQDMHQAPRYDPLEQSDFFPDQRSARPLVAGTVARGFLRDDKVFFTGRRGTAFVPDIPLPITKDLLLRGQERYDVYCSPCHARTGDGSGMIVSRGFKQPPSYHIDRLQHQPSGYFYDVITNGFGAMQDYAAQLQPRDRWAVVAYVRLLQFSRRVPASVLRPEDLARLDASTAATTGGPTHHE